MLSIQKYFLLLLAVFSCFFYSAAYADGFLCKSTENDFPDIQVKLYNQVQPSRGTRNPAVLIVSSSQGTLAVVTGDELRKIDQGPRVTLSGQTADEHSIPFRGNLVRFAGLTLEKKVNIDGYYYGVLGLDDDTIGLVCQRYLKN